MCLRAFISSETGAVTVDWVVLTAAIVGMSMAVMSIVSGGVTDLALEISQILSAIRIIAPF